MSSEARVSRMHFHDNHRKVDYVLAYHYRKRGAHPGHGSPGHSLAIVSNGETGKDPQAGAPGDIELGPLDALEEERKEQREEFEHNLMEAGLELEKDLEVRLGRWPRVWGVMAVLGWVPGHRATCRKPLALFWRLACSFFFFWWANQIFLLKDLRKVLGSQLLVGPVVLVVGAHLEADLETKTDVRDRRQSISSWLAILWPL